MKTKYIAFCIAVIGAGVALLHYRPSRKGIDDPVTFLQEYVRIHTVQPKPDYAAAVSFLKNQAAADGFVTQEIPLSSGLPALIITRPGTDPHLPALALNHHMDVVPVGDAKLWKQPPFEGRVVDGVIYGRGTQDMKGVGVAHYFALRALKDKPLKRTVHIIAVPDEEVGGFKGAQLLMKTEPFKKLNIGFALDEGVPSNEKTTLLIKVAERKPIQIRLTAKGIQGHGSKLLCDNPIGTLAPVLARIAQFQETQKSKAQNVDPGTLLSMNITSLEAGVVNQGKVALNAVPATACATVDVRVPPTMTMAQGHEVIRSLIGSTPVTYEVLATIEDPRAVDQEQGDLMYEQLAQAIATEQLETSPLYFEATTDLRYYQHEGIVGLGFTPFTCPDNLHGIDEAVPVQDLERGVRIMREFLLKFCA